MRPDLLVYISMLSVATLGITPVASQEAICADCPSILVDQKVYSAEQRALLCTGAARARLFFQAHGIDIKQTVILDIRDTEDSVLYPHVGAYSLDKKRISILSFEQSTKQDSANTLFGLAIDEALYRSVVSHEVAHAITDQNFEISNPSLAAREYLAYVAQLSTLDVPLREQILGRYELTPYQDAEEMSSVYYLMAPSEFGIKAYLHFLKLKDPGSFIRSLLSGSVDPAGIEAE